jgi:uncharacterized repeat protein (TIGR03803 family)
MKKLTFFITVFFCLGIGVGNAQYAVLHNFNGADGANPSGTLALSGNKLYGTTQLGGAKGVGNIFSVNTDGSYYKDLFDFDTANGGNPQGSVILLGNKLFGATSENTIFSIDTNGKGFKVLFTFNGINSQGSWPNGALTFSGGKLYGTTIYGGKYSNDKGMVFCIDTNGKGFKDLLDFNGKNGEFPVGGPLAYSSGVLYGMTQYGGANDSGCVFSIDTNGNKYKDLFDFNEANGKRPYATSLVLSGSTLYGTVTEGGAHDSGCIFSIDTNGSGYTDLFDFNNKSSGIPQSGLMLSGNVLYGTTFRGGTYHGDCIFSIGANGSNYTDLFDFDGTDGAAPWNMALISSGNVLYGTTSYGGTSNRYGVVFKFTYADLGVNNMPATSNSINVYPNPSNGVFTIQSSVVSGQLTVYNVLGEKVYSNYRLANPDSYRESNYQIDLSSQPNGVYLYRVISTGGALIGEGKIVKQ